MTSPYLWLLCMLSVIPGVLWWNNTPVLAVFLLLFIGSYVHPVLAHRALPGTALARQPALMSHATASIVQRCTHAH